MESVRLAGKMLADIGNRLLSVDEELLVIPDPVIVNVPTIPAKSLPHKPRLLKTSEMVASYGKPGVTANMERVKTPFLFEIAWDLTPPIDTVNEILCHKKVAPYLVAIMKDILEYYGYEKLHALDIDKFGGMFNFRPQRGTEKKYNAAIAAGNHALAQTYLSRHSWATAWDLDPSRNQLKWKKPKAQFSKPEYKALIDIHYANGFISYGIERDNDWMHFESGLLL